ncbi:FMN-binding glutamate synthase family protein [Piscirickettsia salmonis]|uniref:FMN-binding glutamate synthase family protein n=1 Tax=Piscirickettsia salmonis TaxID=1238 RepID=UPI0007C98E28|nr:Glutamate synthase [NADPH] large chain [Piscirickettsiaceae bacterium NZ-RLO1]
MRRNFYLGFGIITLIIIALLVLWHAPFPIFAALFIIFALIIFHDIKQKDHALLRNFPILGHIRYLLEFFRPEIQQYFIADNVSERPFDRETRSLIYQRAKHDRETIPFGTQREINAHGYEWVEQSLSPVAASEVEPRINIGGPDCKQPYSAAYLNISAMSFGALSKNAILALNQGAKLGGFAHNTGEGGLSPHHLAGGGDIIWQIGTGYFGCRTEEGHFNAELFREKAAHDQVKMIEIKLSQGAKPAHGGILPAAKITPEIAKIRHVPMSKDVLSPPAHSAFNSPEGLLQFVARLRELSNGKPVGFKLCLGRRSEFLGICKAMVKTNILPDFITVDGAEGGTGAAPVEFSNHVGTPLNEGIVYIHNALIGIGVRDKIRLIASGKIATGFDMISKVALGADLCNAARSFMLSLGCIQSQQCNTNHCPTGVATQNPRLIRGLVVESKKYRVVNFQNATVHSFMELLGSMGVTTPQDLQPSYIQRRTGPGQVKNYAEIYGYIPEGVLLTEEAPEYLKKDWERACAENF